MIRKKKTFWSNFTLNNLWKPTRNLGRSIRIKRMRKRLEDIPTPTIFCNNCLGALVAHDLGFQFKSPTVNLIIKPNDFIKLLQNIDIIFGDFTPSTNISDEAIFDCPVAYLSNIPIFFKHYSTAEEGIISWQKRANRIDTKNIYIILVERDGCTKKDLLDFDALPYKNKIALVHKPYPEIKCAYYFKGYEKLGAMGDTSKFTGLFGKRSYDKFDWVNWFNNNH